MFTKRTPNSDVAIAFSLPLTAQERTRSRQRFQTQEGEAVFSLPRGTILRDGDILQDETTGKSIKIIAKPESVLTVTAASQLDLLKAAYHLGNRHVPLEITSTYLRLSSDSVLRTMLEQLGLEIQEDICPFQPETGAYGH